MPMTRREIQAALRARKAADGLKELRGVWVSSSIEEKAVREAIAEEIRNIRASMMPRQLAVEEVTTTLVDLLAAANEIGSIYEMAGWSTKSIATAIAATGAQVGALTISELCSHIAAERARLNLVSGSCVPD